MACMHICDPVSSTAVDRDTAGQERFKTLTRTYYRQAKVGVQVLSESKSHAFDCTHSCVCERLCLILKINVLYIVMDKNINKSLRLFVDYK